jgi:hypothetical protein
MEKDSKENVVNIQSFFKSKEPELSLGQKKLLLLELLVPFFEIVRLSSKGIVLPARGSGDEISCPKCTQKTWSDKTTKDPASGVNSIFLVTKLCKLALPQICYLILTIEDGFLIKL